MQNDLDRLLKVTKGCRDDMHEPDEQGIRCRVIGDHLDNAFGNHIGESQIINGFQEFVVVLERHDAGKHMIEQFNLANLIALARKAQTTKGS